MPDGISGKQLTLHMRTTRCAQPSRTNEREPLAACARSRLGRLKFEGWKQTPRCRRVLLADATGTQSMEHFSRVPRLEV